MLHPFPLTPGCSNASGLQRDSQLIHGVSCPCAEKLQEPQFSFPAAVGADVLFPAAWGSCCLLCGSFLGQAPAGPKVHPSERTAQQGCAERALLALEQGPCRGLHQEGKFPSLLLLLPPTPPTQPISSKRICGVCRPEVFFSFFLTLLLHSSWCLFSCAASCLLHLSTARVLPWVF